MIPAMGTRPPLSVRSRSWAHGLSVPKLQASLKKLPRGSLELLNGRPNSIRHPKNAWGKKKHACLKALNQSNWSLETRIGSQGSGSPFDFCPKNSTMRQSQRPKILRKIKTWNILESHAARTALLDISSRVNIKLDSPRQVALSFQVQNLSNVPSPFNQKSNGGLINA